MNFDEVVDLVLPLLALAGAEGFVRKIEGEEMAHAFVELEEGSFEVWIGRAEDLDELAHEFLPAHFEGEDLRDILTPEEELRHLQHQMLGVAERLRELMAEISEEPGEEWRG